MTTRRLLVLGSTGSIGENTLDVAQHLSATGVMPVDVVGLAAGRGGERLVEQARRFGVKRVAIADATQAEALKAALPGAEVFAGPDAAVQLVDACDATDVAAAVVGSAGLPATVRSVERAVRIGLANKETLVSAGSIVTSLAKSTGAELIPVDSEHSAIFQCLAGRGGMGVKRIVLTASGGPFRTTDADTMANATVEEALGHPTWKMGPKITIDSATMMNKALEVIEAHWFFGLAADQIDVIVHPQSVVHSFVEFDDHSVLAQLGPPDMRTPIQYALTHPDRLPGCSDPQRWDQLRSLDFEPPDFQKFRSLALAFDVVRAGGTAGAIMNGANEAAVSAFLDGRIRFGRIVELVDEALQTVETTDAVDLETVFDADLRARAFVGRQAYQADKGIDKGILI